MESKHQTACYCPNTVAVWRKPCISNFGNFTWTDSLHGSLCCETVLCQYEKDVVFLKHLPFGDRRFSQWQRWVLRQWAKSFAVNFCTVKYGPKEFFRFDHSWPAFDHNPLLVSMLIVFIQLNQQKQPCLSIPILNAIDSISAGVSMCFVLSRRPWRSHELL